MSDRVEREPHDATWSRRLAFTALLTIAAAVLLYIAFLVDHQTVRIVVARRLLPRWDLATHLQHGWTDYHLLVTGRIHR